MLLIGNGRVLTMNDSDEIIEQGAVLIDGAVIKAVGKGVELAVLYPQADYIDAKGKLIMPGMINTHMHLYSTFARGMDAKSPPARSFLDILQGLWWKLDKLLTLEDVYYSALPPLIECIKTGTTTVFDHHASPFAIRDSLFAIGKGTKDLGLRACLCYEVSDRDGEERMLEGIRENAAFISACAQHGDPMLKGMFGLHASFTLSDKTLEKCREEERGSGFHIHVAEGEDDLRHTQNRHGQRVVERLHSQGILGSKTLAVHGIHINEEEMEILAATHTPVIHNPESNMGNAVGPAPVRKMLEKKIPVGLGTDGYTADMFESGKAANCLMKHGNGDPNTGWREIPQMLYENNPRLAERFFGGKFGSLQPGAWADVIVADYIPPTPMTAANWPSHLLFGVSGRSVETTVCQGQILMLNRKLVGIDEEQMMAHAREKAAELWKKL